MSMDFNPKKGYVDGVDCGPGLTKQCFKDQSDINSMVAQFRKTGQFGSENGREPFYGDVSSLVSYQDALNVVITARALFDGLASQIRERFDNDPAKMVSFLSDSSNFDEAVRLGICVARAKPAVEPQVVSGGVSTPSGAVPPVAAVPASPK